MISAMFNPKVFFSEPGPGKKVQRYSRKQVIYAQGDPGSSLLYIVKGRVKLVVTSPHGKEAVVGLLGAKDFFGHECLNGHKGRFASAVAMTECTVTQVARSLLTRLMREEHEFSETFVTYLLTDLARVHEDLIDQLFNSSEKRLARTLLSLARFGKRGKPKAFLAPRITHEMLAEMVGTTRARVSFFMNKFRDMGFIEYNGGLCINETLLDVILHE